MKKGSQSIVWAFIAAGVVANLLFITGVLRNGTLEYWYLPYNLGLGLLPLFLAMWLRRVMKSRPPKNWRVMGITLLWLLFLPNSFYIVTDFIHLPETQRVDMVQDVVMLMQFSVLGLAAGLGSLFVVHKAYLKYLSSVKAAFSIGVVLFLCSLAIYLGRELRWNSWDIVINPLPVVTDSIAIFLYPFTHANAWFMLLSFFGMTISLYLLFWFGQKHVSRGS